ncbi:hypothetical protein ACEPT7_21575 [Burkholderia ubonensis]|uniref:hypothetical protein n=1 Tax=Burkholderia ubonensis TaxID=101571 RepID=UPI00358E7D7D
MPQIAPLYPNATERSLRLASLLFPILVECAKQGKLISYGDLIERTQTTYPDNSEIQRAIPRASGRILDVIRTFCLRRGVPDLASIVVQRGTTVPGPNYVGLAQASEFQKEAFAFNWEANGVVFEAEVVEAIRINKRKPLSEAAARDVLFAYFKENEARFPASIRNHREKILVLLMEGFDPHEAFEMALP